MLQQHAANRVTVEALAHFGREGFGQDEVFKAHALTQGSGHPVAKLCAVLAIGLDRFTVLRSTCAARQRVAGSWGRGHLRIGATC
jgi:hypothetical protein